MKYPAGRYTARAVAGSGRLGKSKNKGTEFVSVETRFTNEGFDGEGLTWTGWLTEKAGERTIDTLRLMGWDGDDLTEQGLTGLGSAEFELVVEGEEYEGKTFSKIKFVNPLPTAMDADSAKALSDRFRDKIKSSKAKAPATTAGAPGDDIPF